MEEIPSSNYSTENAVFTEEGMNQNENSYEIPDINKHEFRKWLLISLVGMFCIILAISGANIIFCFIPIISCDLFTIIVNIRNINDCLREIRLKEIYEHSGSTLAIIVAIVCFYKKLPLSLSLLPYFIGIISSVLAKSRIIEPCQMYSEIIYFIFKITGSLTLTGALVNYDFPSIIDPRTKLIPLWIGILMLLIILFLQILYTLTSYKSGAPGTHRQKLGGLFMIVSLILFTTLTSLYLILCILYSSRLFLILPLSFLILFSSSLILCYNRLLLSTSLYFQLSQPTSYRSSSLSTVRNSIISASQTRLFLNKKSSSLFTQSSESKPTKERHSSVYCILTQEQGLHKRSPTDKPQDQSLEFNIEVEHCLLCADKYANAVIMGCGHGGVCFECAVKMQQNAGTCPICRGKIEKILKLLPRTDGEHEAIAQYEVMQDE